jgi:hypothetical protein
MGKDSKVLRILSLSLSLFDNKHKLLQYFEIGSMFLPLRESLGAEKKEAKIYP